MELRQLRRLRWPEVEWGPADKPIAIVDGRLHRVKELTSNVEGEAAYVVGLNDVSLARVCEHVRVEALSLYEVRAASLEPLQGLGALRALAVDWSTKVKDISALAELTELETLALVNTPKVRDLSPLSALTSLRAFECSGGMWNKNRVESLEPLATLPELRELRLTNLAVGSGGLRPLARCRRLEHLEVSNQFETADYAYLSVHIPHTRCSYFAPWVRIGQAIEGKDTMVTGKRKPLLDSSKDQARLDSYEQAFDRLRAKFLRESGGS